MKFQINFDYNLDQLQNRAQVKFEATRYGECIRNLHFLKKWNSYFKIIYV